jgi:hypothetical protein
MVLSIALGWLWLGESLQICFNVGAITFPKKMMRKKWKVPASLACTCCLPTQDPTQCRYDCNYLLMPVADIQIVKCLHFGHLVILIDVLTVGYSNVDIVSEHVTSKHKLKCLKLGAYPTESCKYWVTGICNHKYL